MNERAAVIESVLLGAPSQPVHAPTAPQLAVPALRKPPPDPYIPQQPRTPPPSGGSVQRGLPDAIGIDSSGLTPWGVG